MKIRKIVVSNSSQTIVCGLNEQGYKQCGEWKWNGQESRMKTILTEKSNTQLKDISRQCNVHADGKTECDSGTTSLFEGRQFT